MSKVFHIADILSVTTGLSWYDVYRLGQLNGETPVQDVIQHTLEGTRCLGRTYRYLGEERGEPSEAAAWILFQQFPWLEDATEEAYDSQFDVKPNDLQSLDFMVAKFEKDYGAFHEVMSFDELKRSSRQNAFWCTACEKQAAKGVYRPHTLALTYASSAALAGWIYQSVPLTVLFGATAVLAWMKQDLVDRYYTEPVVKAARSAVRNGKALLGGGQSKSPSRYDPHP